MSPARSIKSVHIGRCYDVSRNEAGSADAVAFIESLDDSLPVAAFTRYEIGVCYNNGDEIRGQFNDKTTALAFLRSVR